MNKLELIENISGSTGVAKKEIEAVLEAFEQAVIKKLQSGGEVTLTGFGTFSARVRHARMGVDPQKPSQRIQIPQVTVPKFKAGKTLKDSLKHAATPASASAPTDSAA